MRIHAKLALLLLAAPLLLGCTTTKTRNNQPPVMEYVTAVPDTIQLGGTCELRAQASDPEQPYLTYTWEAPAGTIDASGDPVLWHAPDVEGTYTILCTVSDGRGGTDVGSVPVYVLSMVLVSYEAATQFQAIEASGAEWTSQGFMLPHAADIDSIAVLVDQVVGSPGEMIVELRDDLDGGPHDIAAQTISRVVGPGWQNFAVTVPHYVHANVKLHLVVRSTGGGDFDYYDLAGDAAGTYAGGSNQFSMDQGMSWQVRPTWDMKFRISGRLH
jgi:hypothetical protein